MIVGGHGDVNPNSSWVSSRGMWVSYVAGVLLLHLILLCIPFLTTATAWTLTNVIHDVFMLVFLHMVKGAPWDSQDQGKSRWMTHWDQIDNGEQFTSTRKFLTITPIVLFILASFYTKYDQMHFVVNLIALVAVLVPKLPIFLKSRLSEHNHKY